MQVRPGGEQLSRIKSSTQEKRCTVSVSIKGSWFSAEQPGAQLFFSRKRALSVAHWRGCVDGE